MGTMITIVVASLVAAAIISIRGASVGYSRVVILSIFAVAFALDIFVFGSWFLGA